MGTVRSIKRKRKRKIKTEKRNEVMISRRIKLPSLPLTLHLTYLPPN